MSVLTHESDDVLGVRPQRDTVATVYMREIDDPNADRESHQLSEVTGYELLHEGKTFELTTFRPTDGLRTWRNRAGEDIQYPELLMVHGVASDSRYFWSLFQKLNKLGIACAALELPREHHIVHHGDELLAWQAGAVIKARDYLRATHQNDHIVIGGHSRGAIVAAKAAEHAVLTHDTSPIDGILLLAPSIEPKSLGSVGLNLFGLAYNSFRYSHDPRLLGRYATMIAKNVIENPQQTVIEIKQALGMDVRGILCDTLAGVQIFIPAAEKDEFVDHKALARLAQNAPAHNISVTTLNTNHMLGQQEKPDIHSLGDPRLLSGQILAWLQSLTDTYQPLVVDAKAGVVRRLAASQS